MLPRVLTDSGTQIYAYIKRFEQDHSTDGNYPAAVLLRRVPKEVKRYTCCVSMGIATS